MARAADFGIYVHWPFCQSKCPYCDFNSHVTQSVDQAQWADALATELKRYASDTSERTVNTIFFGGGTPSLMSEKTVETVISAVQNHWTLANDAEITLEANPSSVEAARFAGYRQAGVNRVSIGIQALNDGDLRLLGRMHSADEGRRAIATALDIFDRVSFDLIYARQNQSLDAWARELTDALSIGTGHLSLYQLTVEDGTVFGARNAAGQLKGLPDQDLSADMYELTQQMTADAGLPAYEISNHAREGQESRHNMIYWTGCDYLGVGPGAHGRISTNGARYATETRLEPNKWLSDVQNGSGEKSREPLSEDEQAEEAIMMGLRLSEGIEKVRIARLLRDQVFMFNINDLASMDYLWVSNDRIGLTANGRPLLNAILRKLLV
jgi:putative oxygen-independent coproporphyrinogen III oxidase